MTKLSSAAAMLLCAALTGTGVAGASTNHPGYPLGHRHTCRIHYHKTVRHHRVHGRTEPFIECVWKAPEPSLVPTMTTVVVATSAPEGASFAITATPTVSGDGFVSPGRESIEITMTDLVTGQAIGSWTNVGVFSPASSQLGLTWIVAIGSSQDTLSIDTANTVYLKGPATVSVESSALSGGDVVVTATFLGIPGFASSMSEAVPL